MNIRQLVKSLGSDDTLKHTILGHLPYVENVTMYESPPSAASFEYTYSIVFEYETTPSMQVVLPQEWTKMAVADLVEEFKECSLTHLLEQVKKHNWKRGFPVPEDSAYEEWHQTKIKNIEALLNEII